jgi:hypothetical protein
MMNRTAKHLEDIRNIINTNETIQGQMDTLARQAVAKGITPEQWAEFKTRMMTTMFYKMCEAMPELKKDLCADIYEELRA